MPFPTFKTKDEVPEGFRDMYEEKDGKWVPKKESSGDDDGLGEKGKLTLKKLREEKEAAEKKAADAEAEAKKLRREKEAEEKGISKEALDKIREDEAKAREPIEKENAELKLKLRKVQLDDRLEARLLKAGVIPERVQKALKDLHGRVDLTEDGEDFVVKDEKGNITTKKLEEFLTTDYKKEAPFFYSGKNSSGSGAEGGIGEEGGSGYDPVKEGKAMAAQQKKTAEENKLAFT